MANVFIENYGTININLIGPTPSQGDLGSNSSTSFCFSSATFSTNFAPSSPTSVAHIKNFGEKISIRRNGGGKSRATLLPKTSKVGVPTKTHKAADSRMCHEMGLEHKFRLEGRNYPGECSRNVAVISPMPSASKQEGSSGEGMPHLIPVGRRHSNPRRSARQRRRTRPFESPRRAQRRRERQSESGVTRITTQKSLVTKGFHK